MKSLRYVFSAGKAAFPALFGMVCITCSDPDPGENRLSGKLGLKVEFSVETTDVHSQLKAAQPEEFVVLICDEAGNEVQSFSRAGDMPDLIELPVGSYYVAAHSDNLVPAAFDNDYYYGESDIFSISAGETTQVTLSCVLSNIRVTVVYSASVMNQFDDYVTVVSNPAGSLTFVAGETRAAYFDQGPLSIEANLYYTDESGSPQTLIITGSIADALPGMHYEILIDAGLEGGSSSIELVVSEAFETEVITLTDEEAPMSGELLITEIMYNPAATTDTEGEYIEIMNVSSSVVNLMDLVIRRGSTNDIHVISGDIPLQPGEIALLGRSVEAAPSVDYIYSNISLLNSGDELFINRYGTDGTNGEVICRVDYGSAGFPSSLSGQSVQLDPSITDVNEAASGAHWCGSVAVFSTGDLGTPGAGNDPCL